MPAQPRSKTLPTARAVLTMLATSILLTACDRPAASETERSICRELRADLPTWSSRDTAETLASGARFVAVFEAVCG